jgi:hypothetical protein
MHFGKLIWIFPLALAVHNLEEAFWFPAWSQHAGFWARPIGTTEFRVAVLILTLLALALTVWSARTRQQSFATYTLAGFLFAMLLNVVFHVAATSGLRQYAPGVVTAVLINLPVMGYLLWRMFQEEWVSWPKALLAFIVVPLAMLLLIPALLWIGRSV